MPDNQKCDAKVLYELRALESGSNSRIIGNALLISGSWCTGATQVHRPVVEHARVSMDPCVSMGRVFQFGPPHV